MVPATLNTPHLAITRAGRLTIAVGQSGILSETALQGLRHKQATSRPAPVFRNSPGVFGMAYDQFCKTIAAANNRDFRHRADALSGAAEEWDPF